MVDSQFTFSNLINGELRPGASVTQGINPSDRKPLWDVPLASRQDLEDAVAAAKDAFPAWKKTAWAERSRIVSAIRDVLLENSEQMATLLTKEAGKPVCAVLKLEGGRLD